MHATHSPSLEWFWGVSSSGVTIQENLARDEALLEWCEQQGTSALRIWESPKHAVVLGASSRLARDVRVETCAADGVPIGRRASGGGTVLVGPGALNFSVVLPIASNPALAAVDTAQTWILEQSAQQINVMDGCIRVQGSGDWTRADRKIAGSAQRRLKTHVMVHASVLNDFDLEGIFRYLREPERQPKYREGRSHEAFLTNLQVDRRALIAAIRGAWIPPDAGADLSDPFEARVRELVSTKYGDPRWVARF